MKKVVTRNLSNARPLSKIVSAISEQFNERLLENRTRGQVIGHNLEYGLGAEIILRNLLSELLPSRFGIAKGKLLNSTGDTSKHLDLIIYDKINCPVLFIDENQNVILPIEGVYNVTEIKTKTTSSSLSEAFENLSSVSSLISKPKDCSTNDFVNMYPPSLSIFSFGDTRKLETILNNYAKLSKQHKRTYSFSQYSKKSPGFNDLTGEFFLVNEIVVMGKGQIYHMLSNSFAIGRWGKHTFGMYYSSLLSDLYTIKLPEFKPNDYIHWHGAGERDIYRKAENKLKSKTSKK